VAATDPAPRPPGATSRWADNAGLRIHFADARPDAPGDAVVVIPGFGEDIDDHADLLEDLAPRRVVAVDLRGRGRSDVPAEGYDLEAHASDIEAAVTAAGLGRVHLMTYSRGTAYGLSWAFANVGRITSLTIADYPPAQLVPPADLPTLAAERIWKGRRMTDRMPVAAVTRMVADAVAVDFWAELAALEVPVLVIRGGRGRIVMVDEETTERYRATVRDLELVTFEESGHDLWRPDPHRFAATFVSFLERVERAGGRMGPATPAPVPGTPAAGSA
jgi:pimeloyl-ACP methyl ester carboxylesterase